MEWMSKMRSSDITNMVTFIRLCSNLILLLALYRDALLEGVRWKYAYSQIWRTMAWNALEWKHIQAIRHCKIINLYSVDLHVDRFLCCFSSRSVVDVGSRLVKNKLVRKRMISLRPLQLIQISNIINISTLNKKSICLPP